MMALACSPLVAGRTVIAASTATPETEPGSALDALADLLALVPGAVANEAVSRGVLFYHADLKAQFDALGVDRSAPDWIEDVPIALMTLPLALASPVFQYIMLDGLIEAIGFQPLDIDRALETGVPTDNLSILQGTFDRERLESAWEAAGYGPVEIDGDLTMWSKGEEGDVDLQDPLMRIGVGALNNLLLLDDGRTLVISRMGKIVRGVAKQAQSSSSGDSMLGMPHVETVVRSLLPTTASSIVVSPRMLVSRMQVDFSSSGTPDVTVPGGDDNGLEMPAALMASFGIEAGVTNVSPQDGDVLVLPGETPIEDVKRAQARLAMASTDAAEQAVDIVSERWDTLESVVTGQPYRELLALLDADVSSNTPTVAMFDFDQGVAGNRWLQLVMQRDLQPFAPGPN